MNTNRSSEVIFDMFKDRQGEVVSGAVYFIRYAISNSFSCRNQWGQTLSYPHKIAIKNNDLNIRSIENVIPVNAGIQVIINSEQGLHLNQ